MKTKSILVQAAIILSMSFLYNCEKKEEVDVFTIWLDNKSSSYQFTGVYYRLAEHDWGTNRLSSPAGPGETKVIIEIPKDTPWFLRIETSCGDDDNF